ncbi:hypothetical protein PpBr36_07590 [Pyricularia pennisetigena]|uniref:hypothetical protein n=1 Tax=Pyricularia pennisetigena TaxID=1578925 RepID=UPI00114E6A27|nr:hypothetical protein PpBr36_07590 [Pyricularia pennisetigena]TLS25292.1 hypothetical protein PpBr36_07590 [Pyricularia pennisetigena]
MKFTHVLTIGALAISGTVAAPVDTTAVGAATHTYTNNPATHPNHGGFNGAGATTRGSRWSGDRNRGFGTYANYPANYGIYRR